MHNFRHLHIQLVTNVALISFLTGRNQEVNSYQQEIQQVKQSKEIITCWSALIICKNGLPYTVGLDEGERARDAEAEENVPMLRCPNRFFPSFNRPPSSSEASESGPGENRNPHPKGHLLSHTHEEVAGARAPISRFDKSLNSIRPKQLKTNFLLFAFPLQVLIKIKVKKDELCCLYDVSVYLFIIY